MENTGLGGVTVRLSGMADGQDVTRDDGQFTFTGLRAGTYSVEISGFDSDEIGFGSTSAQKTVGVGDTEILTFDGTYIRTASIQGQVSVEGVGLVGVTVTLAGEAEDTDVTREGGLYAFSKLKGGTYTVAISGYDTNDYEFTTTSMPVTLATGEPANIPFEGTLLRTSGISGRVSVDGEGIPDVTVTLAGAAESTYTTMDDGQYTFAGLAEGTYVLSITNPDPVAYNFADDQLQRTVALGDADSKIENFDGTHTRTASISGVLFIDEVDPDQMLTAGEPSITYALRPWLAIQDDETKAKVTALLTQAKVIVRGPSLNDEPTEVPINPADGTFTTGETLMAGSYQVELPVNDDMIADALEAVGVKFTGGSMVVGVEAGGEATHNFPFEITMQTVATGARMGGGGHFGLPVEGVKLALYARADGTGKMLGEAETSLNEATGLVQATFNFPRADDTSPGSEDADHIVFVKMVESGHDDLVVSGNELVEIAYAPTARLYAADHEMEVATLVNVAVNFQFWIKNDENARGGDVLVDGWHTQVFMGDSEDPLMMEDPEDDTKMVNLTMPSESSEDDDGMQGRVMVTHTLTPLQLLQLPATFNVALSPEQPMAMGETWEAVGDRLTYTHTGLEHPLVNTHEANDLNLVLGQAPARFTFTTQKLTVGVYREADDVEGFSDFQSRVPEGDHRPAEDVDAELSVSVMVDASRGLQVYDEWDHDNDSDTDPIDATLALTGGMATFGNLPADKEFTVQFDEGSNRVAVGGPDSRSDLVQAFGDDVELGMRSTGAFGDMSGAGPEVELCPLTTDTRPSNLGDDDSDCATFAYQWTTGSITGDVGRAVKDLDVSIDADTDLHSEAPGDTETDKDGDFSWSGVQDGVYTIAVMPSVDYTIKEKSVRVNVYHDEFEDDDDDDTEYTGTADTDHADFTATKLRLSIKGYAANVADETNSVVRGEETYEGAELELFAYDKDSKAKIMSKGSAIKPATVGADGLYEFNDLDEGAYVIVATNTDDYEMYAEGPDVHYINNVAADTYKDDDVLEQALTLPKWNYENSELEEDSDRSTHTVGTGAAAETFTYYNFALLHGDGEFSGRVFEARGEPEGIAVELRRCETYTAADPDAAPAVEESCREDRNFGAQTEDAGSRGRWDFGSLREGYYVANIAATTYNRAKWGDDGIDDDAANCEGGTEADDTCDQVRTVDKYGMLEGNRAFNRGGVSYYVYNRTLDSDATEADADIVVEGTTNVDAGEVTLGTLDISAGDGTGTLTVTDAVTWATRSITITPDIPERATFTAKVTAAGSTATVSSGSGEDGDDVTLALKANATSTTTGAVPADNLVNTVEVTVTAENGYDDIVYSFEVSPANPVDANLTALVVGTTRAATDATLAPGFGATTDEYSSEVPAGTGTGDNMSVYIRATGKAGQGDMEVMHNGTVVDALSPQSGQGADVHDYRLTVAREGSLQGERVTIAVESEDGKTFTIEVHLTRN